ncbi:MAG TPA: hypothetical protein VGD31_04905, partial [Sphingobacteriaceae bacterium]
VPVIANGSGILVLSCLLQVNLKDGRILFVVGFDKLHSRKGVLHVGSNVIVDQPFHGLFFAVKCINQEPSVIVCIWFNLHRNDEGLKRARNKRMPGFHGIKLGNRDVFSQDFKEKLFFNRFRSMIRQPAPDKSLIHN